MTEKTHLIPSIIIHSSIQYWENCWRSLDIKFLPRQCGQENWAADVHYTIHFNQTFPCTLSLPHSCEEAHARKKTQWRKVKCEVSGARQGLGGGGVCGGEWRAAWPQVLLYQVCRMSCRENKHTRTLKPCGLARSHAQACAPLIVSSRSMRCIQDARLLTEWASLTVV